MKKTIITINGKNGSGKSSAGKRIAALLGYTHKSSGDFQRAGALRHNMGIAEYMVYAETHPEADRETDQMVRDCGNEEKLVLDSRLGFFWIPDSFKVYLDLDPNIAVGRILESMKNDPLRSQSEDRIETPQELKAKIISRLERDTQRYKNLYDVDMSDISQYDLVIDTGLSENNLDTVVEKIITAYKEWLAS